VSFSFFKEFQLIFITFFSFFLKEFGSLLLFLLEFLSLVVFGLLE